MTNLKTDFQGFKMGFRVADQFALNVAPTMTPEASSLALHALKNLVHVEVLLDSVKAFGINGKTVTSL